MLYELCNICCGSGYIKFNIDSCNYCNGKKCMYCKFLGIKHMPYDTCNLCFGTGKKDYEKEIYKICCIDKENK